MRIIESFSPKTMADDQSALPDAHAQHDKASRHLNDPDQNLSAFSSKKTDCASSKEPRASADCPGFSHHPGEC